MPSPHRHRLSYQAKAAAIKLGRERDAKLALTEHEMKRVATLAKTKRLRGERLGLAAGAQPKTLPSGAKTAIVSAPVKIGLVCRLRRVPGSRVFDLES
jgi:hypothetical protein